MPICYKRKFIFIHIPKTGGSSIHRVFEQFKLLYYDRKHLGGRISSNIFPYTKHWHHLKAIDVKQIVSASVWDKFFKFAFVRNPWDRLVSRFFYAKEQVNNPNSVNWRKNYPDRFQDWIKQELLKQESELPIPQYEYITDEKEQLLVDFIGYFERLEEDFKKVSRMIGLPDVKLPHLKRSNHRHYSAYYTDETKQLVARLYKKDIELFGYTFER